ncbi:MAG: YoaK family protein [Leptothrix ochracea]|uniref:YoaK family protein n=1 Tax=Leptothrix ochracea TaxID=735331 RepID=UPI0034E2AA7A
MAAQLLHRLTAPERTQRANRQLGGVLAFVAGAINAGGFLAVQRYTSHMSGIVSSIADNLVIGEMLLAMAGLACLLAFVLGAITSAVLVNWGRRRHLRGEFALPLMVEAALLLLFGLMGANLHLYVDLFVPSTVALLCFIMGLQNAMVTKISKAEIRTTHMTGVITDLGIELGRLLYWNRLAEADEAHRVVANRDKIRIHLIILGLFFSGGLIGAMAFKTLGFSATLPFAMLLTGMAVLPLLSDLRGKLGHV